MQKKSVWKNLLDKEPAVLIGWIVTILVALAGLGLFTFTDSDREAVTILLGAIIPLVQGLTTRDHVYAPANVLTAVKDGEVYVVPEADPDHAGLVKYDPNDLTEGRLDYEDAGPADYIGEHRTDQGGYDEHSPADG